MVRTLVKAAAYVAIFVGLIGTGAYLTFTMGPVQSSPDFAQTWAQIVPWLWIFPVGLCLVVFSPFAIWYVQDKIDEYKCGKKGHVPIHPWKIEYKDCSECGNPFGHKTRIRDPDRLVCERCYKELRFEGAPMVKVIAP